MDPEGMNVLHVVGARPNFMKAAPVIEALKAHDGIRQVLVHTGQHFDAKMSDIFFAQLGMPQPDHFLGISGGSHARMTSRIMVEVERVLLDEKPDLLMVYGDVNSTVAAALVAAKMGIRIAHVEAGLRSGDRSMPEELNRLVTDQLADLLLTPSRDAGENLLREGIATGKIHFVGNVMIDSLMRCLPHARKPQDLVIPEEFALVTLHRPANVDDTEKLAALMRAVRDLSDTVPVIFPIHPRTRKQLEESGTAGRAPSGAIQLVDPLGYLEFLWCLQNAALVLTDSGGIQEETTYLRVPCFTARDNTERPITIEQGTNLLVGADAGLLKEKLEMQVAWCRKECDTPLPEKWDGHTAQRIAAVVAAELQTKGGTSQT